MSINNMATLCLQIIGLQIICVRILSVCGFSLSRGTLATHSLESGLEGRTLSHELRANNDDQDNGGGQNGRSGDSQDHGGT